MMSMTVGVVGSLVIVILLLVALLLAVGALIGRIVVAFVPKKHLEVDANADPTELWCVCGATWGRHWWSAFSAGWRLKVHALSPRHRKWSRSMLVGTVPMTDSQRPFTTDED